MHQRHAPTALGEMLGNLLGCIYLEFKPFVEKIKPLAFYGFLVICSALTNIAIPMVDILALVHVSVFVTQMAWFFDSILCVLPYLEVISILKIFRSIG